MEISKAAVGIFAVVCVAAGAGGAYVATRGNPPAPAVATQPAAPLVSPDPGRTGVEQSEAIVRDPAPGDRPSAVPAATAPKREKESRPAAPARPTPAEPRHSAPPEERAVILPQPAIEPPRPVQAEPERAPEPVGPVYQELVLAADSVIGLQVDTAVTSENARIEDEVIARVTRDVKVGDRVAIPAGSKAHGEVTLVERGGRLKERARLGVRFTSVVLADGTRVPIATETIYREGDAPTNESAAKIGGGAIGGAIIGGILGGAKGAAIGSIAGAGAGTGAVLAGGRNAATLSTGSPVTVRLQEPTTVTVEK
jgi:hypothetical protein